MRLLLIILACIVASAGASDGGGMSTEIKEAVRDLHLDAARRGDLWTAIQLEAYARGDAKLRPVLGASQIHGDPLFAFPTPIAAWYDRGDEVLVASANHLHRLAPDGRPLAIALPLPPSSARALSPSGSCLGVVGRPSDDSDRFVFTVIGVGDGRAVLQRSLSCAADERPSGKACVADDGTAIAVCGYRARGDDKEHLRLWVCDANGTDRKRLPLLNPRGIGANASWLLCENRDNKPVLVVGDAEKPLVLQDGAAGPGIALVLIDAALHLVGRDGTRTPLDVPMGLSASARLLALGGWVVVSSGWDAETKPSVDVLGKVTPGGEPQAPTMALYRWRDLAKDAAAVPAAVIENGFPLRADGEPFALWLWRDNQLDLIDLSRDEPALRALYTAPATIRSVSPAPFAAMLTLADDRRVAIDHLGYELWSGSGEALVFHPQWLVQKAKDQEKPYTIANLDTDAANRRRFALDLPERSWQFAIARAEGWIVATHRDSWVAFDSASGERVADGDEDEDDKNGPPRPRTDAFWGETPGRFHAVPGSARLMRKRAAQDDTVLAWEPIDAWRMQRTLLVLERRGTLLAFAGRKGFKTIGNCRAADRLAMDAATPVVVNDAGRALALLAGATLSTDLPKRLRTNKPEDLPEGAWKVDNDDHSFAIKGGRLVWNTDRLGFAPLRLRCPEGPGMLVVTHSLVIELDPGAAKVVGKVK